MSHDRQPHVKPLSATSVLKLLIAQGSGAKFEIQPEHIKAFEAAVEALSFKGAVSQLMQGQRPDISTGKEPFKAERKSWNPASKGASHGSLGGASDGAKKEGFKETYKASRDSLSKPAESQVQHLEKKASVAEKVRPSSGAGAIWGASEELELKEAWLNGKTIEELSALKGRSSGACFARLVKTGVIEDGRSARAAKHLVRVKKTVSLANKEQWETLAIAEGFVDTPEKV